MPTGYYTDTFFLESINEFFNTLFFDKRVQKEDGILIKMEFYLAEFRR